MWKKGILWAIAVGIAAGVWQLLVFVATTYNLPPLSPGSSLTPQALFPMFALVLFGVAGADLVRFFIRAGMRVKRSERLSNRGPQQAVARDLSVPDEGLVQQS